MIEISGDTTVAHYTSESGDHFLRVFEGHLNREEIQQIVFDEDPDWWDDPEWVGVDDLEHLRVVNG